MHRSFGDHQIDIGRFNQQLRCSHDGKFRVLTGAYASHIVCEYIAKHFVGLLLFSFGFFQLIKVTVVCGRDDTPDR